MSRALYPIQPSATASDVEDELSSTPGDTATIGPVELDLLKPFPYFPDATELSTAGNHLIDELLHRVMFISMRNRPFAQMGWPHLSLSVVK